MDPVTQALLAAMNRGKFSDLSSATMDPVMSYLMGTYQPKPQFDENQLWERYAPNTLLATAGDPEDPYTVAALQIRQGTPPWQLYGQKPKSVKKEATWNKFIDSIAKEQETVRGKLMEQSLEQDPFQKMGLRGAQTEYTLEDMYKYAPDAFAKILKDVDKNSASQMRKDAGIDARYGDVMATSDKQRLAILKQQNLLEDSGKLKDKKKNKNKVTGNPLTWTKFSSLIPGSDNVVSGLREQLGFDKLFGKPVSTQKMEAETKAKKQLKELGNTSVLDVAATARNKSYGDFLKSLTGKTAGSATRQLSDAEKLGALIQSKLQSQGYTPLKEDLLMAVMMKNKMKNG
jgi:hypothetical protein